MMLTAKNFYQFSGVHSLLIGLLPFFLPVLLWDRGITLSGVSLFIAITGVGFVVSLWFWDRLRFQERWKTIVFISFVSELLLLGAIFLIHEPFWFVVSALLNGFYNCFYWSTQRAMFSEITSGNNTGKTFGNFQILVVVLLKLGILVGGYLLESQGLFSVLLLSSVISSVAMWRCLKHPVDIVGSADTMAPPLKVTDIMGFRDRQNSSPIFLLDGPFLFFESYFWVLSLYFLSQRSFFQLGLVVVMLTLVLSVVFVAIKNRIDQVNQQRLFALAVTFYGLSWLFRGVLDNNTSEYLLYPMIVIIGFLTTFFRLSFNKRFFDVARENTVYRYLICKSYYSQLGIAVSFGVMAIIFSGSGDPETVLASTYLVVGPLALLYGVYVNGPFEVSGLIQRIKLRMFNI